MAPLALLHELLPRRQLLWALTRRALVARYRGTVLGFLWSLLHPLLTFAVYALVFGVVVRVDVERYPAFLLAGLLPWTWFAQALAIGSTSVLGEAPFLRQGAFPPALPPLVTTLATAVHFLLALPLLLGLLWAYGIGPGLHLLWTLPLLLIQGCWIAGLTLGLGALAVRYRDLVQIVQAVLPPWFFLTPVIYPTDAVPPGWTWLVWINPLAPLIEGWRCALLGQGQLPWELAVVAGLGVVVLGLGAALNEALRDRIPEEL